MAGRTPRLITIGFSHFCEKARWALDRAGVEYVEEDHVPLLHWRASLGGGGGRTVPVLVTPNKVLRESNAIVHYADERVPAEQRLFPTEPALRAEVDELVAEFDRGLGPAVRRYLYFHVLQRRDVAAELLACTGPGWERRMVRRVYPLMVGLMKRGLKIDPAGAERSRVKLMATLDAVETRLADGRRFLAGDRFTAADLTFAALGAIVVIPPQYGFAIPETAGSVPAIAELVAATRARPAGQFIMRMFAEERPPVRGRAAA
jgi:glutathione S-transferase